jgi:heme-degrading monooxygenase HmoA
MHLAVRRYKVKAGSIDEIVRRANEGFVPLISQASGFIAWYAVDAGNDIVFTVSIFQDQAGADESTRLAADWVNQNLASLVQGPPEITAGAVKVYKAK